MTRIIQLEREREREREGAAKYLVCFCTVLCIYSSVNAWGQQPSIKLFTNLTEQRGGAEYVDLKGNAIEFGKDSKETTGYAAQTKEIQPIGKMYQGEASQNVIHVEAKAQATDEEFGVETRYRFTLPKGRCYQLQGCGRIVEGEKNGASIEILIRTKSDKDTYELQKTYTGMSYYNDEYENDWQGFLADLTDFAGQEIEFVLSLKAKPEYSKIGDIETLSPEQISADWGQIKIVDSSFRVMLGGLEEKVQKGKSPSRKRSSVKTMDWDDVGVYPGTEEKVLGSHATADWYMKSPGESGVNSVKIPGVPSWIAAYFTTPLTGDATVEDREAVPRMFDFSSYLTYNPFNADATTVKNSVYRNNGEAIGVIEPGSYHDENWPNHVAIASATMGRIDGTGNYVVNAFVHCEDNYREIEGGDDIDHARYVFINYARSYYGADFAKSFTKMACNNGLNNHYPIIEYEMTEDELYATGKMADLNYGCGSPSIIEKDGYYYMIFHSRAIRPKSDWETRSGTDRYYEYNVPGHEPQIFYGVWPSISIARASVSAVNSSNYSTNSNPWHKYYERDTGDHWQQPGIAGKSSILINSWLDSSSRRSEFSANSHWRAYPKVSYNAWAANYGDVGNYMLICTGKTSTYSECVLIHNSANLLDWTDEAIVVLINNVSDFNRVYPTIIGGTGESCRTSEWNRLYYQKDDYPDKTTVQDLYRRSLIFERY